MFSGAQSEATLVVLYGSVSGSGGLPGRAE